MKNIDLYLLDLQFNKIAYLDTFKSLIWAKRYNSKGALDLQTIPSTIYKKGYYLYRTDDESLFKINALEYSNNELVIGAEDCQCILYQRIIWKTIVFSGTAEDYIRKIITDNIISPSDSNRAIANFYLTARKGFTDTIEIQSDYETVGEAIEELCQTYDYGFRVLFRGNAFYFDLYKGGDNVCTFSPEYENLGDSKYTTSNEDFSNVVLVGGEGDGIARRLEGVYITNSAPTGLERFESFLDEGSLSIEQEDPIGEEIYRKQLQEKGRENLKGITTDSLEGEVVLNNFTYKEDYNLGDTVFVKDKYNNEGSFRIREITETWDVNGYKIEVSFNEN